MGETLNLYSTKYIVLNIYLDFSTFHYVWNVNVAKRGWKLVFNHKLCASLI